MIEPKCSIIARSKTKDYTCLSKKQLVIILKSYNKEYGTDYKISNSTKREIYEVLKQILKKDDTEWWKFSFIPDDINLYLKVLAFKPKKPKNKWGWISQSSINNIMYQYEEYFNKNKIKFKYFGTLSADYFKLYPEQIKYIYNNSIPIGIIFNTDISSGKGEHWVSIYITKNEVFYFDSNGNNPNKYIKDFIKRLKKKVYINTIEYQKRDGVCGIYAIEYILMKAQNKDIIFGDDYIVNSKRYKYFR